MPRKGERASPAQLEGLKLGRERANELKAEAKARGDDHRSTSEAEQVAALKASLPDGEPSSAELALIRLTARAEVHSDHLNRAIAAAGQLTSQQTVKRVDQALKLGAQLADLHRMLAEASATRVSLQVLNNPNLTVGRLQPSSPERAERIALVLAEIGAIPMSPEAQERAKGLREQLDADQKDREAVKAEIDGLTAPKEGAPDAA